MVTYLVAAPATAHPGGVELSDPTCPIDWYDLPADAHAWIVEQSTQADAMVLFWVVDGAVPAGYPVLALDA